MHALKHWTAAAVVLAALALPSVAQAQQQSWPSRPVKFVLPLGAGSGADLGARLLAEKLSAKWGQPVVVENRPGGDGFVAITSFISSNDDHTLLLGAGFVVHRASLSARQAALQDERPVAGRAHQRHGRDA